MAKRQSFLREKTEVAELWGKEEKKFMSVALPHYLVPFPILNDYQVFNFKWYRNVLQSTTA